MKTQDMILSRDKITMCIKKYGWVLILTIILAVLFLCVSVKTNNEEKNLEKSYYMFSKSIIVSLNGNDSADKTSWIIGDYESILNTKAIEKKLDYQQKDLISSIIFSRITNSNGFKISLKDSEAYDAKEVLQEVRQLVESKLKGIYSNVKFTEIDSVKEKVNIDTSRNMYLKDIIGFLGIIFVGVLIEYLILIFNTRIISKEEIENNLEIPLILEFKKNKEEEKFNRWIENIVSFEKEINFITLNENEFDYIKSNDIDKVKFTNDLSHMIQDKNGAQKNYLILYRFLFSKKDLTQLKKEIDLYCCVIDGYILVE